MVGDTKEELIFPESVNHRFLFSGQEFILGPIGPESKGYLREGMRHLSGESLRNRFFGGKKEFTSKELVELTELDGKNRFALGVIRDLRDPHGIGLIRMDRDKKKSESAEVALTIIDEYQRKGLGTIFIKIMILAALERNLQQLNFTYLNQNSGFERLIKRFSPFVILEKDKDSTTIAIDLQQWNFEELRSELRPYLPEI
jgi:RimJ/RimL family protein N-acetyltransferase